MTSNNPYEVLYGAGTISWDDVNGVPEISNLNGENYLQLNCPIPVALNNDTATDFYIAIPAHKVDHLWLPSVN